MQVTLSNAKANFSKLAQLANSGHRVVITKFGKPYVEMIGIQKSSYPKTPGAARGQIHLNRSVFNSDKDIEKLFESPAQQGS